MTKPQLTQAPNERLFLVSIEMKSTRHRLKGDWQLADEASELKELALAAGGTVVGEVQLKCREPRSSTLIGKGQLEQLGAALQVCEANTALFNVELTPAQQRNIEDGLDAKTLDRTQLILDVFAQRARSQEGKIQVELAQLRYMVPRLVGKGLRLSRLGGGIGTRGPGEQKLEIDRRRIRQRISRLEDELVKLSRHRTAIRKRRHLSKSPVVALVGYTNAGKTTLLNRLTDAQAAAKDQLFTTLDPLARRVALKGGGTVILIDTVGFLHHLPHHLVEAFKSTLEEAQDSDILLHVMDASHALAMEHFEAVHTVLEDLEIRHKPILTAVNKCDLLDDPAVSSLLERLSRPSVSISAKQGQGMDKLMAYLGELSEALESPPLVLFYPYEASKQLAEAYRYAHVLDREETAEGVRLVVRIPQSALEPFVPYINK